MNQVDGANVHESGTYTQANDGCVIETGNAWVERSSVALFIAALEKKNRMKTTALSAMCRNRDLLTCEHCN